MGPISVYIIPGLAERIKQLEKSPEIVFSEVCSIFKKNPEEVKKFNKTRKQPYVEIRQVSMLLFVKKLKMTVAESGAYFGKDHATTIHAIKTVENLIQTDRKFREKTKPLFY